jgi:hypothetical protein
MSILALQSQELQLTSEISSQFDTTYGPLLEGLKKLDPRCDLIQSLLKMNYIVLVSAGAGDREVEKLCNHYYIDRERNVCIDKKGKKNFKCVCGKQHLKDLNLFTHTELEHRFIIGSACVRKLKDLKEVCGEYSELMVKIEEIMEKFGFAQRKKEYRRCWSCRKHTIKRDYEYKEYLNKHFCKNCLVTRKKQHYIPCQCCKTEIPVMRTNDKKAWRLLCKKCWWIRKEAEEGVLNST